MKIRLASFYGFFIVFCFAANPALAAEAREFQGKGEVTSVDPLYGRVTIRQSAIPGFAEDGEAEYSVSSPDLLKGIEKRDLVDFTVVDRGGDVRIEKITGTGVAPEPEGRPKMGEVVQGVLETTGEVAKGVTQPIPPAHEIVSGTVGVTTEATGSVLQNVDTESRQKF